MSLSPSTPNVNVRSFWQRPEGTTGKVFVGAGAIAGLYGFYLLLPFLITLVSSTLTLVALGTALFAVVYVLTNRTFQNLCGFVFKSAMRKLTSIFVEIDPIGILKNYIVDMKKNLAMLDEQISKTAGAKTQLQQNIDQNIAKAKKEMGLAAEAKREKEALGNPPKDAIKAQELTFAIAEHAQQSGRLTDTNKDLTALEVQIERIYTLLVRWRTATQYYINDRENQVNVLTMRYKALKAAHGALQSAKAILNGNPEANALYDQTLEFLAEDAGNKLGDMEDFARVAENFMSTVDLENGAAAQDALSKLDEFERKLLPPASTPGFIDQIGSPSDAVEVAAIPVRSGKTMSAGQSAGDDLLR
jgi:hypothetical protein